MRIRGSAPHRIYSVVVFIILASLDNVAIGIVPPLYGSIAQTFGVGEGVIATPAVADGKLYVRGKSHLYCIGKGK